MEFLDDYKEKGPDEAMRPLESLAVELSTLANEQVRLKAPIEQRWLEDLRQYNGIYDSETETKLKEKKQSRVYANLTRPFTDGAEARFSEMLFPTDDRNWDIAPTPVPELADAQNDDTPLQHPTTGQPIMVPGEEGGEERPATVADAAKEELAEAASCAKKMRETIDDQLIEAKYPRKARDGIRDLVRLGTMVLEGPVEEVVAKNSWAKAFDMETQQPVRILEKVLSHKPGVRHVSPWDYFPDMSAARREEADFELERIYMTKRQILKLRNDKSINQEQLEDLIKEGPDKYRTSSDHLDQMRAMAGLESTKKDKRFEFWKYKGLVKKSQLCGCPGMGVKEEAENENEASEVDDNEEVEAVVLFCGLRVIKIHLPLLETDERGYLVVNWIEDDSSVFGYGVPYSGRNSQTIFNAGWRMLIDNSALSIGPQTVVNDGIIEPADGIWEITTKKVWLLKDKKMPIDQAFRQFNIDGHVPEIISIIEQARRLFEEETGLIMIINQDQPKMAQETATAANIRMNSSSVIIRRVIRQWDDGCTVPLIEGYYTYNMQYHEDDSIKGDYQVEARGSSVLLQKDSQASGLFAIANYAGNPIFGPMLKAADLLRKLVKSQSIPDGEIVHTDEKIAEIMKGMQEAQQGGAGNDELAKSRLQMEYQMHQERLADREQDRQYRIYERQLDQQNLVLKLSHERDMSIEQINTDLQKMALLEDGKQQRFYDELNVKMRTGHGI